MTGVCRGTIGGNSGVGDAAIVADGRATLAVSGDGWACVA